MVMHVSRGGGVFNGLDLPVDRVDRMSVGPPGRRVFVWNYGNRSAMVNTAPKLHLGRALCCRSSLALLLKLAWVVRARPCRLRYRAAFRVTG